MRKATTNLKAREVQFIHIAKTQLAMDDATYRAMLHNLAGVTSSKDLSDEGRTKVIKHLKKCGGSIDGHRPEKDHKDLAEVKQAIEKKIGVQLAKLDKPWAYAYGTAKKIFPDVVRFEFLSVEQMQKVSGALDRTIRNAAKKAAVAK